MKYFIANWKAYKNLKEAKEWFNNFDSLLQSDNKLQENLNNDQIKIIVAPPHPFLADLFYHLADYRKKLNYYKNIQLSAQDISQFDEGNYTGENTAKTLKGLIEYTLVGHSERRRFVNETDEVLFKKCEMSVKYGIKPIFIVRNDMDSLPVTSSIIAYEPESAIGSGENESVETIVNMKKGFKLNPGQKFLYGGSINSANSSEYLNSPELDGFLIGKASLNPAEFLAIVSSSQ